MIFYAQSILPQDIHNQLANTIKMKREKIQQLFQQFENAVYEYKGIECWSARELQEILGYSEWRNFLKVIEKAKDGCRNAGVKIIDQFVDVNKLIQTAKSAQRQIDDVALTRYACYLIAQNGDSAKAEIAFAQTYFAVQTRKQEIIEHRLLEGVNPIEREHIENNSAVRNMLIERGVKPELLPPSEDTNKVKRRLQSEEKKLLVNVKLKK